MDLTEMPRKLWEHPDPKNTEMYRFMQEVNKKHGLQLKVSELQGEGCIGPFSDKRLGTN